MIQPLRTIYQIKIALKGISPPIWRRILVPSSIRLDQFHGVLQIAMGWTNSHLHQFVANGKYYGMQDDDFGLDMEIEMEDENQYKLSQLLATEKTSILYEYDFGDSWEHTVTLEKIMPFDPSLTLPVCTKGKRNCPPEDCGGIWGYQDLLKQLADPDHPEYEELIEWLGGEHDAEYFDLEKINALLDTYCR